MALGLRLPRAQPKAQPSQLAQPSLAQVSSAQPRPARPVQPGPLPKAFLTGFRGPIFGRETAPFLVRFWPVWGRRAAAFRCFGAQPKPALPAAGLQTLTSTQGSSFCSFSVRVWPVSGRPAAAFPRFEGWVWIAEARSPKPSAQPRLAPAQASPAQASSARPLPKAFLTGFRGPIFGRETAPFLVRFWRDWGRRAAAFRCFGAQPKPALPAAGL